MNSFERNEIGRLPAKYKPLTGWNYFWYGVLFAIPVIGWIALIVCSASGKNVVRRSYARCTLTLLIIFLVAVGALVALFMTNVLSTSLIVDILDKIKALLA